MPPIFITNEQRDAGTATGEDSNDAFESGIFDQSAVIVSPPIPGYADQEDDVKQAMKDGLKQLFVLSSRYFMPIAASFANGNPSHTISSNVTVGSTSVTTFIPRKVVITVHLSAYATATSTKASVSVQVGGVDITPAAQYLFNVASDHRSMGGTWAATLPAGTSTIALIVGRSAGLGSIILDSGDSVTMTVVG